jgi:hypothetical protein
MKMERFPLSGRAGHRKRSILDDPDVQAEENGAICETGTCWRRKTLRFEMPERSGESD